MENKKKIQERFLPYSRQNLDKNDIEAVKKVLKSNFLTQGPQIQEFEKVLQGTLIRNMQSLAQLELLHCIWPVYH